MGNFTMEENRLIIREVIGQKPSALEDTINRDVDWRSIAESLNRPEKRVYKVFINMIQPTLRRHLAGTLEQDVRAQLVQQVGREGWTYSAEVDFGLLEGLPQFKGHTRSSLQHLYTESDKTLKDTATLNFGDEANDCLKRCLFKELGGVDTL